MESLGNESRSARDRRRSLGGVTVNKDLFHVVRPASVASFIVIGGQLRIIPANTLQVISLRATGARHADGAKFGEVVYEQTY